MKKRETDKVIAFKSQRGLIKRVGDIKIAMSILVVASFCSCRSSLSDSTKNDAKPETGLVVQSTTDRRDDPVAIRFSNTVVGLVWERLIQDGKYRLANQNDFTIPEWAIKLEHLDTRDIQFPFILTSLGYAAIVVDTTRSDAARFGLVILTTDEGEKVLPDQSEVIHWFCRNKDLSRTVLGGAPGSAGLHITGYKEDGTAEFCRIDWDEKKQEYECKTKVTRTIQASSSRSLHPVQ